MRVGLAGVGRIGVLHAVTLRGLDTVDQAVVADGGPARAQAAVKELYGEAADDVEALFRADRDAIGAPDSVHAELIARAHDAGLTTVCEKPLHFGRAEGGLSPCHGLHRLYGTVPPSPCRRAGRVHRPCRRGRLRAGPSV